MKSILDYAISFIGVAYIWGGNHPQDGFDCSGLVQEILSYADLDPVGDQNAQSLFAHLVKFGTIEKENKAGAVIFYGKSINEITHVAFSISKDKIIEAGGGGAKNTTKELAMKYGGWVRVRPFARRKDVVSIIMPNYPQWCKNEFINW